MPTREEDNVSRNARETSAATEGLPLPHDAGMIERVAVAMCNDLGVHAYDSREEDGLLIYAWQREASTARAAIEAMRDHTESMLDAGTRALWPPNDYLPGSAAVAAYRAMIDAALSDAPVEASPLLTAEEGPGRTLNPVQASPPSPVLGEEPCTPSAAARNSAS